MRTIATLALGLLAPIASLAATAPQPGRWQLFQGEYQFVNIRGEEHWLRGLFKLDTATGQIFICSKNQFDGEHIGKPKLQIQRTECVKFEGDVEAYK
jgi:hypothetical protein